jgi:hypothetical protein
MDGLRGHASAESADGLRAVLATAQRGGSMTGMRIAGLVLVIVGIAALLSGGVFWKERDTVVDAGPLKVQTEKTKGFPLSPVVGGVAVVAGVVLMAVPARRRV